jgi:hypothetical protein
MVRRAQRSHTAVMETNAPRRSVFIVEDSIRRPHQHGSGYRRACAEAGAGHFLDKQQKHIRILDAEALKRSIGERTR